MTEGTIARASGPLARALEPLRTGRVSARVEALAAAAILAFVLVLGASTLVRKSVTWDEYAYVPGGLAILETGRFDAGRTEAPLSKVLVALPVLATDARLDRAALERETASFGLGRAFLERNRAVYPGAVELARLPALAALLVLVLVGGRLARRRSGPVAGLAAMALAGTTPDLLAHGTLATQDVFVTAGILAALLALDRFLESPTGARALVLGLALGVAPLLKLSGLLLWPLVPLAAAAVWLARRRDASAPRPSWAGLALALLVAVLVLDAGYLFDGVLGPLGRVGLGSPVLRGLQRALPARLPLPVPEPFVTGLDQQLGDRAPAWLLGELRTGGSFPHYYLVALLVKTPLPLLAVGLAAAALARRSARDLPLLVVGGGLLAFFSLAGHKNLGVRYVLFVEPLLAVVASGLVGSGSSRLGRAAVAGALVGMLGTALATWPHSLAYFNLLAGGPEGGHRVLLDSNLDWGQDLLELRRFEDERGIESVDLAHDGKVPPDVYGVRWRPLGTEPRGRFVAISANLLWGRPYFVNGPDVWLEDPDAYAPWRTLEPVAILGHTVYVFDRGEPR